MRVQSIPRQPSSFCQNPRESPWVRPNAVYVTTENQLPLPTWSHLSKPVASQRAVLTERDVSQSQKSVYGSPQWSLQPAEFSPDRRLVLLMCLVGVASQNSCLACSAAGTFPCTHEDLSGYFQAWLLPDASSYSAHFCIEEQFWQEAYG